MLKKVIKHHNLNHIHDIWPNLQVYTSGGVAFGPYEKSFNALMGKPVIVIDTYLASEGYIATQVRPETDAMQLNTDEKEIAKAFDKALKAANNNYKVARTKALKGVKVSIISSNKFYEWNERNSKKGEQVKMERVMDEEKFAEWEAFIKNN